MSSVEPDVAEAAVPEVEVAAPPPDPYAADLAALTADLGDGLVESGEQRGDLWVRVRRDAWKRTGEVLCHQLGYDYFCFLSAIDWMPPTWPNPKIIEGEGDAEGFEAEPEPDPVSASAAAVTGFAGGATRFQVLARVYGTTHHRGIFLKCDLDDDAPQIESWHTVYPGANWHERETWEMYGIDFVGHPNQIHLYLPGAFEGFPLRKDFPLLSREVKPWPGLVDVEQFPPGTGLDDAAEATDEAAADAG